MHHHQAVYETIHLMALLVIRSVGRRFASTMWYDTGASWSGDEHSKALSFWAVDVVALFDVSYESLRVQGLLVPSFR